MKVNEIFYSLQGEGRFTGTPAVFIRLSGCNLRCDFCDTAHKEGVEMTEEEIAAEAARYPARHVVITGGEPTIQLNSRLVKLLHYHRKFVQIETNGTRKLHDDLAVTLDWVTVSPKFGKRPAIERIDELKVVYDLDHVEDVEALEGVTTTRDDSYFLQPCDRGEEFNARNIKSCIGYILAHPKWRLSLQTHKLLDIR
ncbi:MAG: 7-carboxy-7-deazaguanine synthase QueE [Duncaniella sp.]|nr:7-carboxy-7-deazaguanine synthase QueE [Duncaniella sp.]